MYNKYFQNYLKKFTAVGGTFIDGMTTLAKYCYVFNYKGVEKTIKPSDLDEVLNEIHKTNHVRVKPHLPSDSDDFIMGLPMWVTEEARELWMDELMNKLLGFNIKFVRLI